MTLQRAMAKKKTSFLDSFFYYDTYKSNRNGGESYKEHSARSNGKFRYFNKVNEDEH